MARPQDHPPIADPKIGVLLVNLGSPDAPTKAAVKRYLAEFLSDRRVIEIPPIAWQPILRGIILNTRPKKSAALYASIWDHKRGGSPLKLITEDQTAALAATLPGVLVDHAMRYGAPAIAERLTAMKDAGCDRILICPMYPQYSAATTATVIDKASETLGKMRWQPSLRTVPPWYDDPLYIDALAKDVNDQVAALDFEPDEIIVTFHGMPARTLSLGDPYHCHCQKTSRLLGEKLARPYRTVFQSRFGPAAWLQPYLDKTLAALPSEGVRKIAVVAPGFVADCLETLEEIAGEGKELFMQAGGTDFAYLACLNARAHGIELLASLVKRELGGWIETG
ncbi:ferrochelatase [Pacificimonas sp. WHA3]|uniref:Ferrochelatase n=1 Tax=Pacificimonas pallii TaxID=2827236 RepID=A0ABS6SD50_9SPHN|nr:ferrochelatase [Pacificimonas pallii]